MTKKRSTEKLEKLVQIIAHYPNGMSVEELLNVLADNTAKRTLQYRLFKLVASGMLKCEGAARKSRYYTNTISRK